MYIKTLLFPTYTNICRMDTIPTTVSPSPLSALKTYKSPSCTTTRRLQYSKSHSGWTPTTERKKQASTTEVFRQHVNETPTSKYVSLSSIVIQDEEDKFEDNTTQCNMQQHTASDARNEADSTIAPESPHLHASEKVCVKGSASYEGWSSNDIDTFRELVDAGMFSELGYIMYSPSEK